jgi:hypothetical protein
VVSGRFRNAPGGFLSPRETLRHGESKGFAQRRKGSERAEGKGFDAICGVTGFGFMVVVREKKKYFCGLKLRNWELRFCSRKSDFLGKVVSVGFQFLSFAEGILRRDR